MPAVPPEDTSARPFTVLQRRHHTFLTHFTVDENDRFPPIEHDSQDPHTGDRNASNRRRLSQNNLVSRIQLPGLTSSRGRRLARANVAANLFRVRLRLRGGSDSRTRSWSSKFVSGFYLARLRIIDRDVINHGRLASQPHLVTWSGSHSFLSRISLNDAMLSHELSDIVYGKRKRW